MGNKTISVPINAAAEEALDYDRATPQQLIEEELSEEEFNLLWKEGYFDLLNHSVGAILMPAKMIVYADEST